MSIKVLIVGYKNAASNPYISTLADGLIETGCDVTCSVDEFWNNSLNYDIVHFQWPNFLVKKMSSGGENLSKTLKAFIIVMIQK